MASILTYSRNPFTSMAVVFHMMKTTFDDEDQHYCHAMRAVERSRRSWLHK